MSKLGIVIAGVLALIGLIVSVACTATHEGSEWEGILRMVVSFLTVPLMVVAVAAGFTALRGGDGVAPAVAVLAAAALGVALIQGVGAWATPLALAACAVAPLFARRPNVTPPTA